ncbi:hypothetical protein ACSVIJ_17135 [Pseudomonas sp. NCHU5208]|uniref:hypothetical protein n=1 Tax=unclassified Pseudomonas TaxID=196821 RepID=UPI003F96AF35
MSQTQDVALRLCETVSRYRHLAEQLPAPICLSFLAREGEPAPKEASHSVRATERALNSVLLRVGVRPVYYVHGLAQALSEDECLLSTQLCQALDYTYTHFDEAENCKTLARVVKAFDFDNASAAREPVPGAV